jgi:hypothetical protein
MREIVSTTLLLFSFFVLSVGLQGQNRQPANEQISFSEHLVTHPVELSTDVLKLLLATKEGKQGLTFASEEERKDPSQLFIASEVHLGKKQRALVVLGRSGMSGADNDWFWIVLPGNHPRIVLWAGAYSLRFLLTRTNGLRDVETQWSSASEVSTRLYKFDGGIYRLWTEKRAEKRYP